MVTTHLMAAVAGALLWAIGERGLRWLRRTIENRRARAELLRSGRRLIVPTE